MSKIDFVPNEYIQQRESNRANVMYLLLFAALMGGIGLTFSVIKVRQKAVDAKLKIVNAKMRGSHEQIAQLEELKIKSNAMMKTVSMTSELLDPVPKSVILASLTNNLPNGVSLLKVDLVQKDIYSSDAKSKSVSQYKAAKSAAAGNKTAESKVKSSETHIEIEGIAPSDIGVAAYIAQLSESILFSNVTLVESKEYKIDGTRLRQFKLTMMLKKDLLLTKEDIDHIRSMRDRTI